MNWPLWVKWLLWPLSVIYGVVAQVRVWLYAKGILKQHHLHAPVISVGNLTVGGTGKTPMVLWLAEDHRRFTSAADGKIPDADDRSMQMMLLQNSFCVEPYAHLCHDAINHRQRPEQPLHPQGPVHLAAPPSCTAINASARSRAPRLFSTSCRAASPILRIFSGSLKR